MQDYLNGALVREALHIPDSAPTWEMCSDSIDYTTFETGSQWVWEGLKGQYKMLKFSGNTDGAVPTTGTLGWIRELNREVLEEWRPYLVDGQIAGFVEVYDGLTLGVVNGAGHMAPQYKPKQTYHLIFQWIKGETI